MNKTMMDALLAGMMQSQPDVSDLLFMEGKAPLVESYGRLHEFAIDTPGSRLTSDLIDAIANVVIAQNARLLSDFSQTGSCDASYEVDGVARLRVNIFKQNTGRTIVMRKFPAEVPTLEKLGLPPVLREVARQKNGIVLVTGASGNGKSSTLAAVLNELNQTEPIHILTLEDPIEFIHPPGCAAISQRELGRDFSSFAEGLRVALRQAPKGILLGEIRDRETMEIAMTASETGHIVYATLHTVNAGQTIHRILGMFGKDEEQLLRQRLSETVRYIVSQRLIGKIGGGRHLITEIMGSNLSTREAIMFGEKEDRSFQDIIETSKAFGWHSFDQDLLSAYEDNLVTEETALLFCNLKNKMRRDLQTINKRRLADVDEPSGLTLDLSATNPATAETLTRGEFSHA
jgi:twitching motility protein PilT